MKTQLLTQRNILRKQAATTAKKELEAQLADILRELEEAEKIYEPEPLY